VLTADIAPAAVLIKEGTAQVGRIEIIMRHGR
jgi:hypothetical protein